MTAGVNQPRGLVIFGCDGVLVDSGPINDRVLGDQLAKLGLSPAQTERLLQAETRLPDLVAAIEIKRGQSLPADWLRAVENQRWLAYRAKLKAIAGAAEAVAAIEAAGFAVCVANQGAYLSLELALKVTELRHLFAGDHLFSAYSVPCGKPHPDLYLSVADRCGFEPADCLVVDDSPNGASAGRLAGMEVVLYSGPGSRLPRLAAKGAGRAGMVSIAGRGLVELFDQMAALPQLVESRLGRSPAANAPELSLTASATAKPQPPASSRP